MVRAATDTANPRGFIMRERYRYEIATSAQNGRWTPAVIRTDTFSRDPESIARGLLEQWIIDHAGRLRGGRVIVYTSATRAESARLLATVRVRVYKAEADDGAAPVAVAYLGEFDRSRRSRDGVAGHTRPRHHTSGGATACAPGYGCHGHATATRR
jgi:hypothetical protein